MDKKMIKIKSLTDGQLGIVLPDLHFKRIFERKGAIKPIPEDILEEAMWDEGFKYLLTHGMIEIMNEEVKKDLGIAEVETVEQYEEEEKKAEAETIILRLSDAQKKRYLTVAPISELKQLLKKLNEDQIRDLAEFAITNNYLDFERADVIKKAINVDIIAAVKLRHELA